MAIDEKPDEIQCEAMQKVHDKIKNANLTFEIISAVQLAKVFRHYRVKGFAEEKEIIPVD